MRIELQMWRATRAITRDGGGRENEWHLWKFRPVALVRRPGDAAIHSVRVINSARIGKGRGDEEKSRFVDEGKAGKVRFK